MAIKILYAFCTQQADGNEGVVTISTGSGWLPLITADISLLEALEELAINSGKKSGRTIVLKRFVLIDEQIIYEKGGGS